ncbi:MAG: sulfurtransferase TusA family protein [Desulfobaccales bacterium]
MKFLDHCPADATADLVYRACPMHLLEPMELMKDLKEGQVLEILTDYDGALEDIPAWCAKHGQEFMGISEDACNDCYKLYIKKLSEERS